MDWTEPNVCTDDNLAVTDDGLLALAKWSVPRNVIDVMAKSGADGKVTPITALTDAKLMIDQKVNWINDSPLDALVRIRVTRATRSWVTSNPNAIEIRDRWSRAIDRIPDPPVVTSLSNGRCGSAIDLGTNSVAEPNPGRQWAWQGAHDAASEWVTVEPGQNLWVWYRCYYWTPPPWSDNANKSNPQHSIQTRWSRIQLIAYPTQGLLVSG